MLVRESLFLSISACVCTHACVECVCVRDISGPGVITGLLEAWKTKELSLEKGFATH